MKASNHNLYDTSLTIHVYVGCFCCERVNNMVLILALVLRKTMVMLLLVLSFMCGYLSYGPFLEFIFPP